MNVEVSEMEFLKLLAFHYTKEEFVAAAKTWVKKLSFYLSIGKSDTHCVMMVCVRWGKKYLQVKQLEQSNAIVLLKWLVKN